MKRVLKVFVLFASLLLTTQLFAAFTVGVVDAQQVLRSSSSINNINKQLDKQFAGRKKSILALDKSLQANIKKLQKNQSVMSAKAVSALRTAITKQAAQLRQSQAQYQQNLYVAQNKAMALFMKKLQAAVGKVAQKKKLDLVLPKNSVLYSNGNAVVDITSQVQKYIK